MVMIIKGMLRNYFSDPEAIILLLLLFLASAIVIFFGDILAPFLASIVIAYLLEWLISRITVILPRSIAFALVYISFLGFFVLSILLGFPALLKQASKLVEDFPLMMQKTQNLIQHLSTSYPKLISPEQIQSFTASLGTDVKQWGKVALSLSLSTLPNIITWIVYAVLVPLLVFFFLKDKELILNWCRARLPKNNGLIYKVANDVNMQIANYIRGKFTEIFIVTIATYMGFLWFNLNYALLLSVATGFSVLIPYIGAVLVIIPVVLVAFLQFGMNAEFGYVMVFYLIIDGLDANILVPVLFAEAVNLHPIAIVLAILVFGGFWGFWGLFFAIPLATLIKAVINSWPKQLEEQLC